MALLCNLEIVTKIHKEMLHSDLSAQLSHSMNNPKIKEHLNHSGHDCTQAYQLPYGKWKHINECPTSYFANTQSNRLKSLTICRYTMIPNLCALPLNGTSIVVLILKYPKL